MKRLHEAACPPAAMSRERYVASVVAAVVPGLDLSPSPSVVLSLALSPSSPRAQHLFCMAEDRELRPTGTAPPTPALEPAARLATPPAAPPIADYHWHVVNAILTCPEEALPRCKKAETIYTLLKLEADPPAPRDFVRNKKWAVFVKRICDEAAAKSAELAKIVGDAASGSS